MTEQEYNKIMELLAEITDRYDRIEASIGMINDKIDQIVKCE